MSTKAHSERLSRALESTGLCETVSNSFGENRVAVLCRVKGDGNEKKWVALLHRLLLAAEEESKETHAWQCHICRHYFLKGQNMVWGWNVSFQSKEISISLDLISRILKGQSIRLVNRNEVTEMPLHGATADRGMVKGGKGVHTIGNGDFHPMKTGK